MFTLSHYLWYMAQSRCGETPQSFQRISYFSYSHLSGNCLKTEISVHLTQISARHCSKKTKTLQTWGAENEWRHTVDSIRLQGNHGETVWKNKASKMSVYGQWEKPQRHAYSQERCIFTKPSEKTSFLLRLLKAQSSQEITKGLPEHRADCKLEEKWLCFLKVQFLTTTTKKITSYQKRRKTTKDYTVEIRQSYPQVVLGKLASNTKSNTIRLFPHSIYKK